MSDRLEKIREREARATPGPWEEAAWGYRQAGENGKPVVWAEPNSHGSPGAHVDHRMGDAEFIAHAREDVPWLLEQVDTWRAHAEADHAKLEQVAELVQQWRAKGAQADFLGVANVWDDAADQLAAVLAKETTDDHETAETIRYTADVALLTDDGQVLLIQRGHDPFAGKWAFPGGHVDKGERAMGAAFRELEEETGIRYEGPLLGAGVYDTPGRDPRGRYVTIVFTATIPEAIPPTAGDDAAEARWWPLTDLPPMAFDHAEILVDLLYGPTGGDRG
jgi:8-oxo-dGTP diphosphatase